MFLQAFPKIMILPWKSALDIPMISPKKMLRLRPRHRAGRPRSPWPPQAPAPGRSTIFHAADSTISMGHFLWQTVDIYQKGC